MYSIYLRIRCIRCVFVSYSSVFNARIVFNTATRIHSNTTRIQRQYLYSSLPPPKASQYKVNTLNTCIRLEYKQNTILDLDEYRQIHVVFNSSRIQDEYDSIRIRIHKNTVANTCRIQLVPNTSWIRLNIIRIQSNTDEYRRIRMYSLPGLLSSPLWPCCWKLLRGLSLHLCRCSNTDFVSNTLYSDCILCVFIVLTNTSFHTNTECIRSVFREYRGR